MGYGQVTIVTPETIVRDNHYNYDGFSISDGVEYVALEGQNSALAVEASRQVRAHVAKTFSNFWAYISANTLDVTTGFFLRDDGVTTLLGVNITNGVTGIFFDDTNSVAVSADSLVNMINEGQAGAGTATITCTGWTETN